MDVLTNSPGESGIRAYCGLNNIKINLFIHLFIHLVNASLFVSRCLTPFVILLCCINMKETVLILRELPFYYREYSRRK